LEERIASIFRVVKWFSKAASKQVALLNHSTTLKMEAIRSSETSGTTKRTTRRHIPEEDTLQNHHCENLKSYMDCILQWEMEEKQREFINTGDRLYNHQNTTFMNPYFLGGHKINQSNYNITV
jgi:hypothetical protein